MDPSEPGHPVDVNVAPSDFVKLSKIMKLRGIKYEIHMENVQEAIDNEKETTDHAYAGGYDYGNYQRYNTVRSRATITRCDLSPQFFCIDATLLCEFESDKI